MTSAKKKFVRKKTEKKKENLSSRLWKYADWLPRDIIEKNLFDGVGGGKGSGKGEDNMYLDLKCRENCLARYFGLVEGLNEKSRGHAEAMKKMESENRISIAMALTYMS